MFQKNIFAGNRAAYREVEGLSGFLTDEARKETPALCRRCNGTGYIFVPTAADHGRGEIHGYDTECPQCGGSGEEETFI